MENALCKMRSALLQFVSPVYPHDITIYHNYDWSMFKFLSHPCWPKNILSLYRQSYWFILCYITIGCCLKHVRCNLDVCPELMSCNQRIVQRGWLILIPHEDKVYVVSPFSILCHRGWRISIPHDDQVILFPHEDNCIQGIFHMPPWPNFTLGLAWIRNFPATQNCLCYVTMMSLGER